MGRLREAHAASVLGFVSVVACLLASGAAVPAGRLPSVGSNTTGGTAPALLAGNRRLLLGASSVSRVSYQWSTSWPATGASYLAADTLGNVYTLNEASGSGGRVEKYNSAGTRVAFWGPNPDIYDDGEIWTPTSLAVNAANNEVYVLDGRYLLVHRWSSDGAYLSFFAIGQAGLAMPWGMAVGGSNVFITDYLSNRFVRYSTAGFWTGGPYGSQGSDDESFNGIQGIATDRNGAKAYVCDDGNARVKVWDSDGYFDTFYGGPDEEDGKLTGCAVVAVDGAGAVYAADATASRIVKYSPFGGFVAYVGAAGVGNGEFEEIKGVAGAMDNSGVMYAADAGNRIQKFVAVVPPPEPSPPPPAPNPPPPNPRPPAPPPPRPPPPRPPPPRPRPAQPMLRCPRRPC